MFSYDFRKVPLLIFGMPTTTKLLVVTSALSTFAALYYRSQYISLNELNKVQHITDTAHSKTISDSISTTDRVVQNCRLSDLGEPSEEPSPLSKRMVPSISKQNKILAADLDTKIQRFGEYITLSANEQKSLRERLSKEQKIRMSNLGRNEIASRLAELPPIQEVIGAEKAKLLIDSQEAERERKNHIQRQSEAISIADHLRLPTDRVQEISSVIDQVDKKLNQDLPFTREEMYLGQIQLVSPKAIVAMSELKARRRVLIADQLRASLTDEQMNRLNELD